jgi:hypothetical protein
LSEKERRPKPSKLHGLIQTLKAQHQKQRQRQVLNAAFYLLDWLPSSQDLLPSFRTCPGPGCNNHDLFSNSAD